MGKVQEALTKLHSKINPAMSLAASLRIPTQREHHDSGLPTDADSVKQWIIAQEAVNSAPGRSSSLTTARTLLRALQHSNRSICTTVVRLQIMEQYEALFRRTIQALDSHYLYQDFPMQPDAEKTFLLANTLFQEMAYGFKIAIANSLHPLTSNGKSRPLKNALNEKSNRAKRHHAIQSAMAHITQLLLRHSQIYREWPSELWQDLNALTCIARRDQTFTQQNMLANSTDQALTVQQQYASLCALHILDHKQMTAEEVRSLFVKIVRHVNLISFENTAAVSPKHNANSYCVGRNNPPVLSEFVFEQSSSLQMYFSLEALLEKLRSEDDDQTIIVPYLRPKRAYSRKKTSKTIKTHIGLEQIHQQIMRMPPEEFTEPQFTDPLQLLEEQKVLDSIDQNLLIQEFTFPHDALKCSTSFTVENESAGGFGLKWSDKSSCKIHVGEIVSHCYKKPADNQTLDNKLGIYDEISWHLGMVVWLRTSIDGTLHLGVKSLSHHAKAVNVIRGSNPKADSKNTVSGLLINYQPIDSKARMLILPEQHYRPGETLAYHDGRYFCKVKLIESVRLSVGYQCFAIQKVAEDVILSPRKIESPTEDVADISAEQNDYQIAV